MTRPAWPPSSLFRVSPLFFFFFFFPPHLGSSPRSIGGREKECFRQSSFTLSLLPFFFFPPDEILPLLFFPLFPFFFLSRPFLRQKRGIGAAEADDRCFFLFSVTLFSFFFLEGTMTDERRR